MNKIYKAICDYLFTFFLSFPSFCLPSLIFFSDMIPNKRKNQKNHVRKGKKKGKEKKDDTDGKIRGMLDEEM